MPIQKAKIYTKTGDQGTTSLVTGTRVSKADTRLSAYGTLDELNASLGIVCALLDQSANTANWPAATASVLIQDIRQIQNVIFRAGSLLACDQHETAAQLPQIQLHHLQALERRIDEWTLLLPPLHNFILPGNTLVAAHTHLARTICRRAERYIVALANDYALPILLLEYINRLSDYLFVLGRYANQLSGAGEIIWDKQV